MTSTNDYWMTAQEVADEQRITVHALYNWRSQGRGPRSSKRGARVLYRRSDVDKWIAEQERLTAVGGADGPSGSAS